MVDLGRPEQYGGSEGVVEIVEVGDHFAAGPLAHHEFELLVTDESPTLYRVRYISVSGDVGGTVGSVSLTFEGLTSGGSGSPWPTSGPLVAAADTDVLTGESFHYTWNTEISDNYSNTEFNFGRTWVGGLPLMYLPKLTTFAVLFTAKGGYDGDYHIGGGVMQVERFRADTVLGGNAQTSDLYLLPAAG